MGVFESAEGIENILETWYAVKSGFDKSFDLDKEKGDVCIKATLCTAIDYVAAKCNMTSVELMDEIFPQIKRCNAEMGRMEI